MILKRNWRIVMRPNSNIDILLRSNEILLDMIDTLLHESYITPERMLSFEENYHRCKKAHDAIKVESASEGIILVHEDPAGRVRPTTLKCIIE
jgi:hypothetical protein